jgi:hypothetical protein
VDYNVYEQHTVSVFRPEAPSGALKMDAVCFSKMFGTTCKSTQCHNPADHHGQQCSLNYSAITFFRSVL